MASDRGSKDETDLATALDAIAGRMLSFYPQAQTIRIVATGPDGEAVIPVPLGPRGESIASDVIEFLGRLKPGEWANAKTIAAALDKDPNNGSLKRCLADLAARQMIESNRNLGYRLPQTK